MGILNVTPDSFSDGGRHDTVAKAVDHAARLLDEGADMLDIGGESTRPGADAVGTDEELARILSHCAQFNEALGSAAPVGRKLEFLVQELNREINTVGSKAAEHPIAAKVVDMKSVLERMKEQAANVE